jgi:hypothetical protein
MELILKEVLAALAGYGREAVGWAAISVASRLSEAASKRMATAPIRVFVCVAQVNRNKTE